MKTQKEKTVFIEYSSSEKGQHFMTVIQLANGKKNIIGRIYKEYDKENKKMNYIAHDWAGNQVFADTHDLFTLKKKFVESGKYMIQTIPNKHFQNEEKDVETYSEKTERENDIQEIRERKTSQEKEHEIER